MDFDATTKEAKDLKYEAKQLASQEPGWSDWTYEEAEAWLDSKSDAWFENPANVRSLFKKVSRMLIWLRDHTDLIDKNIEPPEQP
jgi:hypothetical protein